MKKISTIIALVLLFALLSCSNSSVNEENVVNKTPSEKTESIKQPTPEENATLNLEAGIIYKVDGVQSVARTDFHLLNEDLEKVLQQIKVKSKNSKSSSTVIQCGENLMFRKYFEESEKNFKLCLSTIKSEAAYSVTTDFNGKAKFENVKPKSYYLVGITETKGGFAIWNLPVEVKNGENSVVLDQNNAEAAF